MSGGSYRIVNSMSSILESAMTNGLERFVAAQQGIYEQAREELQRGAKRSHWMWFVFPQIHGLGSSAMARQYAIQSRAEAEAYLQHPVLGERLRECTRLVNGVTGRTASEIFGYPDDLKFRSSLTLFAALDEPEGLFAEALGKYFAGQPDPATLARLD